MAIDPDVKTRQLRAVTAGEKTCTECGNPTHDNHNRCGTCRHKPVIQRLSVAALLAKRRAIDAELARRRAELDEAKS